MRAVPRRRHDRQGARDLVSHHLGEPGIVHGEMAVAGSVPGIKSAAHLLDGWSVNPVVLLQTGTPWCVGDLTTDFSGTGEILEPSANNTQGEQWNFYGNANDFKAVHGLTPGTLGPNNPKGGIPYFAPTPGNPGGPTANAACNAKARALDGGAAVGLAQAALSNLGCYAVNGSILIPPAYGTLGNLGRSPFYRHRIQKCGLLRDQGFQVQGAADGSVPGRVLQHFQPSELCQSLWGDVAAK
jgi:hypothetical protein